MRQKYGVDALQLRTPEAPISELDDEVRTLQPRIPEAVLKRPAPIFESDDEDIGLDLFED